MTHQPKKRCKEREADQPTPACPSVALVPTGSNYLNLFRPHLQDPFSPLQGAFQSFPDIFPLVEKSVLLLLVVVVVLFHSGKSDVFLFRYGFTGRHDSSRFSRCRVRKNYKRCDDAIRRYAVDRYWATFVMFASIKPLYLQYKTAKQINVSITRLSLDNYSCLLTSGRYVCVYIHKHKIKVLKTSG